MGMTRRDFLMHVGQAGGYSATFATMQALGMHPMGQIPVAKVEGANGSGKGIKLVVVGGGVAGLTAAYEAKKLGYDVTLLEAKGWIGGRNWTLKPGETIEFVDGTKQLCTWGKGMYQNLGAGRLPSVHQNILTYCKELGVPLEVEVNTTRSSYLQSDKMNDGKPIVQRKAINDLRGDVSELLSKAISTGSLDSEIDKEDKQRVLDFLRVYGPLDHDGKYVGSDRSEVLQYPGAGKQDMVYSKKTLSLHDMLDPGYWNAMLYEEAWDWQATMFQPVGGMQNISFGFERKLGPTVVIKNAPVSEIEKTEKGVTVTYSKAGVKHTLHADYCICAMPLTILRKIKTNFSPAVKEAVDVGGQGYRSAYKIAWESRRFWEQDYNLYGGLSFLSQGVTPIWYPSANMFSERGVVVVGYQDEVDNHMDTLTMEQRFARSRESMEKIHPGHGHELEKPIYDAWRHIKWNEGSWIGGIQSTIYNTLTQPDGRVIFAGDHTSHVVGWQEGACLSGKRAITLLSEQVKSARLATPVTGKFSA